MSWIYQQYKKYRNGIIFTLIFHILVFIALNISQFKIKKEYIEPEILIDFPEQLIELSQKKETESNTETQSKINSPTNRASNKATQKPKELFDEAFQKEMKEAQELVNKVSKQLSKEIPTFDDLKIPEETTKGMNPDSIMNKQYNGDSNVEYFLEKRYHLRLPIPVYLSQYEGIVTVNIIVDSNGNVVKATPITTGKQNDQILSFAKTAALRTKFNASSKPQQKGYISYHFIAQ